MDNITFQYSPWYILLCLALGLAYAGILYYRDRTFRERSAKVNGWMGLLRFVAVSSIAMLLLSPLIRSILTETKKPIVVVAQDQSESVIADMNEETKTKYQADFEALKASLAENYEVKDYAFGENVREGVDFKYEDKVSNISEFLSEMYDLYSNQNLGAVIMATDGVYNEGNNPVYAGTKLTAPIYSIALGDTIPKKDLVLKRVFHNKIAYLNDRFSIQIDVAALNALGGNTNLTVSKVVAGKTKVLQKVPISINKNDFFTTKEIVLDANAAGVQRYRVSVNSVAGEVTTSNNSKDIFVDVLDARQKILIMANSPHPDLAALKQIIETNKNYETTIAFAKDAQVNIADFDFVILHQLPSKAFNVATILSQLNAKKTPRLFIVGSQTDLGTLNKVQPLMSISGNGRNTDDVQGVVAADFSLFNMDEVIADELPNFAPIQAPFGDYKNNEVGQVLLYQRVGKVKTKRPLLVVGEEQDTKVGVLAAEGLWRWRLFDYLQNKNHDLINELMSKSIQYLTVKEDKRKFRVTTAKSIFNENEPIIFDAELYNNSYQLINEPDASLVITDDENRNFNFTFSRAGDAYTLNAGILPVGNYKYKASVFTNEQLSFNGQFSVQPVQLESFETTADHRMLRLLSTQYGGQVYYPTQLASLGDNLVQNKIKPVLYQTTQTQSIMNIRWLFLLLALLLFLEWFLRRYWGGY